MMSATEWIMSVSGACCATSPFSARLDRRRMSDVELGLDRGAERAERVEALRARPLAVALLQVAGGDVVARSCSRRRSRERARPARSSRSRRSRRRARPRNRCCCDCGGPDDRVARADHRGVRLEEQQRLGGRLVAHLGGVVAVVLADARRPSSAGSPARAATTSPSGTRSPVVSNPANIGSPSSTTRSVSSTMP